MLNAIRYTMATICLAASVGCLALWWQSYFQARQTICPFPFPATWAVVCDTAEGVIKVTALQLVGAVHWESSARRINVYEPTFFTQRNKHFTMEWQGAAFPLWYPALAFVQVGFATIRIGRPFTLRSVLFGMSVVAAMLGMVVTL